MCMEEKGVEGKRVSIPPTTHTPKPPIFVLFEIFHQGYYGEIQRNTVSRTRYARV